MCIAAAMHLFGAPLPLAEGAFAVSSSDPVFICPDCGGPCLSRAGWHFCARCGLVW